MAPKNKLGSKTLAKADKPFTILVFTLLTIGLIMLFSASHVSALYYMGDSFHYIKSQLMWAAIGLIAMYFVSRLDYHIFHRLSYIIMAISFVLLVVVLFMPAINHAKRWIQIPGLPNIQASEIAKFGVIVLFSHWIAKNQSKMKTFKYGVIPFMIILGGVAGLMILEPHLSGTVLIMLIGLTMMFVGGTNKKLFVLGGAVIAVGLVAVVVTGAIGYAGSRIEIWLDPFKDTRDAGFQTVQSLYAIGSGGFFGVGLGNSRQKQLYVPEPQNDFIFSIVCEELGFVGATIIVIIFMLLLVRGVQIAMRAKDKFGSMLALGLTIQVALQALLNIMVVTNTIPNTGISLPFFSYGGSSLVMLLAQMGVVLNVSRQSTMVKD